MAIQTTPPLPFRQIEDVLRSGYPDRWVHPEWEVYFSWLVQGTTGRTASGELVESAATGTTKASPADFALFRDEQSTDGMVHWVTLARSLGFPAVVGSRQVHGDTILFHDEVGSDRESANPQEAILASDADGHVSTARGVLMGVTVADCVPVFLVDPTRRALALLHAGWRGAAAGVLKTGIRGLGERLGSRPRDIFVHLGPAICGSCYEVGPEVHEALGLALPGEPTGLDLRLVLGQHALVEGVPDGHITVSSHCTKCSGSPFFSHRRGDRERQLGFLGVRPTA